MSKVVGLIVCLISFISCQKEVKYDKTNTDERLVVEALIGNDSNLVVNLSHSTYFLSNTAASNEYQPVNGAVLALTDNTTGINFSSSTQNELGQYVFTVKGVPGRTYTIQVDHDLYTSISATTTIPGPIDYDILSMEKVVMAFEYSGNIPDTVFKLRIKLKDPVGQNGFVMQAMVEMKWGKVWGNDTVWYVIPSYARLGLKLNEFSVFRADQSNYSDEQFNYGNKLYFSDDNIEGQEREFDLYVSDLNYRIYHEYYKENDAGAEYKLDLNIKLINKETMVYLRSVRSAQTKDSFSEPTLIQSNVENGLGVFGAYTALTLPVYKM
jgi:hypothetical protein